MTHRSILHLPHPRADRQASKAERDDAGRRVAPLFPTVAASYVGFAMMSTLFVPMLMSPSEGFLPADATLPQRTATIGVMMLLYPLGQFFGNPLLGSLSDRFGRRPMVLASTAATILCYVGIATALALENLVLLAPFLLLCGLAEGTVALTMSAIADVTDAATRPRYLGYVYATTSISFTFGPVAGGLIAERVGYAVPFWLVVAALAGVLIWLHLRFTETRSPADRRSVPLWRSLAALSQVVTDRPLRRSYLANFLLFMAAMGFWRIITIYLVDEWQLSVGAVSAYYTALAVAGGVANLVVMPRLSGRVPLRPLGIVAISLGAALMAAVVAPAALGVPFALPIAVGLAALATVPLALSLSVLASLLSNATSPDRQGQVLGNNAALLVFGEVIGIGAGSLLAGIAPALPIVVLAAVAALAAVVLPRHWHTAPQDATARSAR